MKRKETRNAESFYSETQFSEWLKHIGGTVLSKVHPEESHERCVLKAAVSEILGPFPSLQVKHP